MCLSYVFSLICTGIWLKSVKPHPIILLSHNDRSVDAISRFIELEHITCGHDRYVYITSSFSPTNLYMFIIHHSDACVHRLWPRRRSRSHLLRHLCINFFAFQSSYYKLNQRSFENIIAIRYYLDTEYRYLQHYFFSFTISSVLRIYPMCL